MVSELIAQLSAVVLLLVGCVAVYFSIKSFACLKKSKFKNLAEFSTIFLILITCGILAMVISHFVDGISDVVWYFFIFISLFFSLYESYKWIVWGKRRK